MLGSFLPKSTVLEEKLQALHFSNQANKKLCLTLTFYLIFNGSCFLEYLHTDRHIMHKHTLKIWLFLCVIYLFIVPNTTKWKREQSFTRRRKDIEKVGKIEVIKYIFYAHSFPYIPQTLRSLSILHQAFQLWIFYKASSQLHLIKDVSVSFLTVILCVCVCMCMCVCVPTCMHIHACCGSSYPTGVCG